jgi:DNA-binding transcriptional MerR regulator
MQEILFYRELDFSLKTIAQILSSPNYDKEQALSQQKKLLTLKKERLEGLIAAIDGAMKGENVMKAFNNQEFETYKTEAQNRWGKTQAYQEFSEKTKDYSEEKEKNLVSQMDTILEEFALCMKKGSAPQGEEAQALVKKLQAHITESYYVCTNDILAGLGQMYVADERFQQNIDKHGEGTSQFISQAIAFFCKKA